jgi:hypothetical protein
MPGAGQLQAVHFGAEKPSTNLAFGEGFRTPAATRHGRPPRGRRSKASQGGNRGQDGLCMAGCDLWGFEGHGRRCRGDAGAGGVDPGGWTKARGAFDVGRVKVWREPGAGIGPAGRGKTAPVCSGARPEARRSALRGRKRGAAHEVSILIGVEDGERAGRMRSKVSMTIIRPPQHGHRRSGVGFSMSCSFSARERSGAVSGVASIWRTRSMLRARTAPANRP